MGTGLKKEYQLFQKVKRNSKLSMGKILRCTFFLLLKKERVFSNDSKEIQEWGGEWAEEALSE